MEEDDFYTRFRQQHPKQHFQFPDISQIGALSFKPLTLENAMQLYCLFQNDASSFVDKRLKNLEEVTAYVKHLTDYGAYSPKHGAQD